MFIKFSTKPDKYGNRYYLEIETENRVFSRVAGNWYSCKDPNIIVLDKAQRRKLINELENAGFVELYHAI